MILGIDCIIVLLAGILLELKGARAKVKGWREGVAAFCIIIMLTFAATHGLITLFGDSR